MFTFKKFMQKMLAEEEYEPSSSLRDAASMIIRFENSFGTEKAFKLLEITCLEEVEKFGDNDPKYCEYIMEFLHRVKREMGQVEN